MLAGAGAAHAGRRCDAAKPTPRVIERGMALAQRTAAALDQAHARDGTQGVFTVAMLCEKQGSDAVSHAFVIGSATTFTDYWVQSYTASDEFMLNMLYYMQEESPVDLDILPKSAVRASLSLGSLTGATVAVVLIPLIVLLAAAFVLMPRKNL